LMFDNILLEYEYVFNGTITDKYSPGSISYMFNLNGTIYNNKFATVSTQLTVIPTPSSTPGIDWNGYNITYNTTEDFLISDTISGPHSSIYIDVPTNMLYMKNMEGVGRGTGKIVPIWAGHLVHQTEYSLESRTSLVNMTVEVDVLNIQGYGQVSLGIFGVYVFGVGGNNDNDEIIYQWSTNDTDQRNPRGVYKKGGYPLVDSYWSRLKATVVLNAANSLTITGNVYIRRTANMAVPGSPTMTKSVTYTPSKVTSYIQATSRVVTLCAWKRGKFKNFTITYN